MLRPRTERTGHQQISVDKAVHAVQLAIKQYQAGTADFTTVTQFEQIQVQQQDLLAQSEGEIDTGLIAVYRALGGGWQGRVNKRGPRQLHSAPIEAACLMTLKRSFSASSIVAIFCQKLDDFAEFSDTGA